MKNNSLLVRLAQSSSALGAGILGLGLGIWLEGKLHSFEWPLIISGFVLHTVGMTVSMVKDDKLDKISFFWKMAFQVLFWICLAFIIFLFVKILFFKT